MSTILLPVSEIISFKGRCQKTMAADKLTASKCSEWHIKGGTVSHIIELSQLLFGITRGKVF